MAPSPTQTGPCPATHLAAALSLVLSDEPPEVLRQIVRQLAQQAPEARRLDGLQVALASDEVLGACWAQVQPGNTAIFWPPQLRPQADPALAVRLARAAAAWTENAGIDLAQALLARRSGAGAATLLQAGFWHLADLSYLWCGPENFPDSPAADAELNFAGYRDSADRQRLISLLMATYEHTLDCPRLGGCRQMQDVVDGYQATGITGSAEWRFIQAAGRDVGALLLAEQPGKNFELIYMGLVPEARRRGWGRQIVRHAKWMAGLQGAERLVLAVDNANRPALTIYRGAGFTRWEERSVFVRARATARQRSAV